MPSPGGLARVLSGATAWLRRQSLLRGTDPEQLQVMCEGWRQSWGLAWAEGTGVLQGQGVTDRKEMGLSI